MLYATNKKSWVQRNMSNNESLKMQIGNFYIEIPDNAPDYVYEIALIVIEFAKKFIETQLDSCNKKEMNKP